ncbi:Peroxisome biogenesis protein 22 [Dichanthelium oligosanthes]|uniref:Peroxisome biogenesis protein 22 n=1 Tax=Dichanthelium oligosanthes TaxID=888268 RepID=A0A1E5UIR8_9POAL|nr:Peroxisome biogenesis protein 22 [Dichanthelium oligosanthes]
MASASAPAPAAGAGAGGGKDDELADLVRRLVDALARYADRLPFNLDRQLTLEQLVRHKLSEGRRVTCRLLGVILEETTPEELQNRVTVRPSVVDILLEIAKFCDVYLMERVLDDESEEKILSALSEAGLFASGALVKEKVLFCSTENGRTSFVRQLEPDWHIDTSPEIVHQLAVKVYQISTAHFATAIRKNSIQRFQLSKLGAVFWRPGPEMIRGQTPSSKGAA